MVIYVTGRYVGRTQQKTRLWCETKDIYLLHIKNQNKNATKGVFLG